MNPLWFVFAIAALVGSYLLTPRPRIDKPKPNTLEDFEFPQVDEGTAQIVVFGDVWISDWHVLYYGNMRTSEVTSESASKK